MTAPPQLSEDRRWWWDGVRWRRVGRRWGLALGLAGAGIVALVLAVVAFGVAMVLGLTDWGLSDEPTPGWVGPTLLAAWYGFWLCLVATAGCLLAAVVALLVPRR